MLLAESIVPATIPDPEKVRILLICTGQLRAGKLLNVDVALGVGIFGKLGLRVRTADAEEESRADDGEMATMSDIPLLEASLGNGSVRLNGTRAGIENFEMHIDLHIDFSN